MYRSNKQNQVTVKEIKLPILSKLKIKFWKLLFQLFNFSKFEENMYKAYFSSLPEDCFNCVDCNKRECICPDCVLCKHPFYDCICL